jgi:hypothetical protein
MGFFICILFSVEFAGLEGSDVHAMKLPDGRFICMADEQDVRTNLTTGPEPSELEAKKAEVKSCWS